LRFWLPGIPRKPTTRYFSSPPAQALHPAALAGGDEFAPLVPVNDPTRVNDNRRRAVQKFRDRLAFFG
jgi:hypothetical protein